MAQQSGREWITCGITKRGPFPVACLRTIVAEDHVAPISSRPCEAGAWRVHFATAAERTLVGVTFWNEREGAKSRTGATPNFQRWHDEQELIRLPGSELFKKEVLDDIDPVVGDQQHV